MHGSHFHQGTNMLSGFLNVRSPAAKQAVITAISLLGLLAPTYSCISFFFLFLFLFFVVFKQPFLQKCTSKTYLHSLMIKLQAKRSLRLLPMGRFSLWRKGTPCWTTLWLSWPIKVQAMSWALPSRWMLDFCVHRLGLSIVQLLEWAGRNGGSTLNCSLWEFSSGEGIDSR